MATGSTKAPRETKVEGGEKIKFGGAFKVGGMPKPGLDTKGGAVASGRDTIRLDDVGDGPTPPLNSKVFDPLPSLSQPKLDRTTKTRSGATARV
jgi:hypothetical protein